MWTGKSEFAHVMFRCFKKGNSAKDTRDEISTVYGSGATTVRPACNYFKNYTCNIELKGDDRSSRRQQRTWTLSRLCALKILDIASEIDHASNTPKTTVHKHLFRMGFDVKFWFCTPKMTVTMNRASTADCVFSERDRVRVSEWVRKLVLLEDDNYESIKKKNEYIQYLKIQVTHGILQIPFTKPPPDSELPPLPEMLANALCSKIPEMPKTGPISPAISRKSPDGRAYISIKHVPGDGVLCYMAVTPNPDELHMNKE